MSQTTPIRWVFALLAVAFAAEPVSAQHLTIRGVVQERAGGAPVADAALRLDGGRVVLSAASGRFVIDRVAPGRHVLEVHALGYASTELEIDVRADTTLVIALEAEPLQIDPVEARAVTISGSLHDAETGRRLSSGTVRIDPGGDTDDANGGRFRIRGVQAGSIRVVARALEYLPVVLELEAHRDTTLRVDMRIDSVGLKMLFQQVDRLAQRADAEPYSVRALNRDDIRRTGAGTVGDLLRTQLLSWRAAPPGTLGRQRSTRSRSSSLRTTTRSTSCVTYDDVPIDLQALDGMLAADVERIEIFGFAGRMIRVYSRDYVAGLMGEQNLPRIYFVTTGMNNVCM